ncbi:hypothetical protein TURU_054466 [Turdus rufiventris]|nr:hypothetical protein TURU_054466 [Turdus rufiventris]
MELPAAVMAETQAKLRQPAPGRNTLARGSCSHPDTKVSGEGGAGDGPDFRTEIPLQPGEDHGKAAVSLQPMEEHKDADIHLQHVEEPHARAGECLRGGCDPVGGLCWSRLLAGTCRPMERGAHAGADFLAGFVTLWGPHPGAGCA